MASMLTVVCVCVSELWNHEAGNGQHADCCVCVCVCVSELWTHEAGNGQHADCCARVQ